MHRRLLLVAVALCLFAAPTAQGQHQTNSRPAPQGTDQTLLDRPDNRPPEDLPIEGGLYERLLAYYDKVEAEGTLSDEQIMRRMARIYGFQSKILDAQATGDGDDAERTLELAMTELSTLVQQPGILERPRFLELYRTVITEYEKYYGVSDSVLSIQRGDIFQFRADIFAALDDVTDPLLEDVMLPDLQPIQTVFPMTMNRLVESSISYLTKAPHRHVYHWLSRAETYFPMIEQIMQEEGVPDELKYLAMIESGLNPTARSWAKAGGMWQFIVPTGAAYGLDVNSYVDERMDPEKATRAAARHLKDLHKLFGGDWQLALAGYNCSPRRIQRAIKRAEARTGRKATFWDIYDDIPRETRNYVPMFIAAALVTSNPGAFGLEEPKPGPRYEYDYVPVSGMIPLATIAELAGTEEATIKALNPELRRSTTPPTRDGYYVRIPLGTYSAFTENLAKMPEVRQHAAQSYTVRRGDSLGKIAKRYGVSVTALKRASGLRSTTIRPGQRLTIPVPRYETIKPSELLADGQPASIRYGARMVRPIVAASQPRTTARRSSIPVVKASHTSGPNVEEVEEVKASPKETKASAATESSKQTRITYRVRRGDSLGKIAKRYGVTVSKLKRWNNIRGSKIRSGQRLTIYAAGGNVKQASASSSSSRVTYRVRRGDSLSEIAKRYGVSVSKLRSWNNIRGSKIRSGQRLTIYPGKSAGPLTYRVRRGDSLGKIAKRYGVRVSDLKRWNGLRSTTIRPGQRLKIHS